MKRFAGKFFYFFVLLSLMLGAWGVQPARAATTWTVDLIEDTDDGDCTLGDCTLREAINDAADGDTIDFDLTLPATIILESSISITKSLTIDGPNSGELTISGGDTIPLFVVFYNATPYSLSVNDLTLADANRDGDGGAINSYGNLTINNVYFKNNSVTSGNGAAVYMNTYVDLPSPLTLNVTNSVFDTNLGTGTGAIFSADSNVNIFSSSFNGNSNNAVSVTAAHKPIAFYIANSTFTNNSAPSFGGAIGITSINSANFVTAYIYNVTFAENTAPSGGSSLSYSNASNVTIKNTLFADNSGSSCQKFGIIAVQSGINNIATDTTCNTAGIPTTTKTLAQMGLGTLVTSPTYYYPLSETSAALEAGDATTCADGDMVNSVDQIGTIRPQATICDIGAIEYTYTRRYAEPSGLTSGACESWANACDLQYALLVSNDGDEIWVKTGTYTPHASDKTVSFHLKNGVAIYGGFDGIESLLSQRDPAVNFSILSGDLNNDDIGMDINKTDNSYHVVYSDSVNTTAILDGFVITNGYATDGDDGSSVNEDNGGGLFNLNGSPTLRNLALGFNSAEYGGAIASFAGNLALTNVTFYQNEAIDGGGLTLLNSDPVLTNVTFFENSAWERGGAMHIQSSSDPVLMNVTVSENSSDSQGGGISLDDSSQAVLTNVILWGNTAPTGAQVHVNDSPSSSATITYSVVEGGFAGTGNISTNPLLGTFDYNGGFTPTLPLGTSSSAINTGTNTGCPSTSQNGLTRPQGASCDMGAYEYEQLAGPFPTFADVPLNAFAWAHIESIYAANITGGCSTLPKNYCPNGTVTRAQMAVFLMKGIHGSSYSPPPATGAVFNDVAINSFAAAYIEAFADEGITGGCGGGNFCPDGLVTRAQMAVFLLKAKHGSGYTPPTATGTMFNDVPSNAFAAAWIEQLATEGITGGCGSGNYCPNNAVSRAQMAVFLQKTFNLPMP